MAAPSIETAIAISRAMRRLRGRLRQESQPAPDELSLSQTAALGRIVDDGPLANAALAASEHMRPQSMNEIVAVLAERGLVVRRPDPGDGRRVLIEVSESGRAILDRISSARYEWLAAAIERELSDAEREIVAVAAALMERVAASGRD